MLTTSLLVASPWGARQLKRDLRGAIVGFSVVCCLAAAAGASPQTRPTARASRLAQPPQIDAVLNEWSQLPPTVVGEAGGRAYEAWQGPDDLMALFWVGWDQQHLYFAAEVSDDQHYPYPDVRSVGRMFRNDCIQLGFDMGLERSNSGYDGNDYEIGLGDTEEGPRVFRWHAGSGLGTGVVPQIELAVHRGSKRTCYEAAIPWQQLIPFSPQQRDRLGFAVMLNDNDGQDRGHAQWAGGIAGSKQPAQFGTLQLLPGRARGQLLSWLVAPTQITGEESVPVTVRAWSVSPMSVTARLVVSGTGGQKLFEQTKAEQLGSGLTDIEFTWPATQAPTGQLTLTSSLHSGDSLLAEASLQIANSDPQRVRRVIEGVTQKLSQLHAHIEQARELGRQAAYPQVSAATVELNLPVAEQYLAEERYVKAADFAADLEEIIDVGLTEVQRLIADPPMDLTVPQVSPEQAGIRAGSFYVDDSPTLFLGPLGWWHLYDDIDVLHRLGFNSFSLSLARADIVNPEPDRIEPPKHIRWATDRARDNGNLAVGVNLAFHSPPQWAGLTGADQRGTAPWQDLVRRHCRAVSELVQSRSNFQFYVLWGESSWQPRDSEFARSKFAEWLRGKHLTVGNLNDAWDSNFASFAAAAEVLGDPDFANPGIHHDVSFFRAQHSATNVQWASEVLHSLHPGAHVMVYPSLLNFDDPSDYGGPLHVELLCHSADVNGADTTWSLESDRYATGDVLFREVLLQDLLRSINPAQPNFDPELHLVNYKVDYSADYVRSILLQAYLHGLDGAFIWVWERGENWDTQLLDKPHVLHACGRTALDLRRLADIITAFQGAPAEVAILYSASSLAYRSDSFSELNRAYEAMFFTDARVDFVTERQAAHGGLEGYKLVICPATAQVPRRAYRAFGRYVRGGGTLLLVGDCFTKDEYRRPRQVHLPGKVARLPVGSSPADYRSVLERELQRLGVDRLVRASNPQGQRPWGVECRSLQTAEGRLLGYVYNMSKDPQQVQLDGAPASVVNLLTNQTVSFPRQMQPLEFVLFEASAH